MLVRTDGCCTDNLGSSTFFFTFQLSTYESVQYLKVTPTVAIAFIPACLIHHPKNFPFLLKFIRHHVTPLLIFGCISEWVSLELSVLMIFILKWLQMDFPDVT